jgi:hypothetical protein
MSERRRKLQDLLVVFLLRYGQTQDNRLALAALVAYQSVPEALRPAAIGCVEGKLRDIEDKVIPTIPRQGGDQSTGTLAALVRSAGLVDALKSEKARRFKDNEARASLHRIAPELAKAIEAYDLDSVYNFLKPEAALREVA